MHKLGKTHNLEALSLYHQRYPKSSLAGESQQDRQKENRKNLLGLMSSFACEEKDLKAEEVQQLCCYDRMKKLLLGNEENIIDKKSKEADLANAMLIETKISRMEKQMNTNIIKKTTKTSASNCKYFSQHFVRKQNIVKELQEKCLNKYISHKVEIKEKQSQVVKSLIEKETNAYIDKIIQERNLKYTKLEEEKEALSRCILVKQLEIQSLKTSETHLKNQIKQLEEKIIGIKPDLKRSVTATSKNQNEIFMDKFNEMFNYMTLEEVKIKLDISIQKCLEQFDRVQNKNQDSFKEQASRYLEREKQLKNEIKTLQHRQNELIFTLKNTKINKQISEVEINELCKAKLRLHELQKLILSIYNDWYAKRSENEKQLSKQVGNLSQTYSYEEMLKYIVEHEKSTSTNAKLNDYILKLLRGIKKLKRVIYPAQCNDKLDPLAALDKIQKWIKRKMAKNTIVKLSRKNIDESFEQDKYFDEFK